MMIARLFRLELRHLVRRPLTWGVLGLLLLAMLAASAAGVARVEAQRATLNRVAAVEQRAVAQAQEATRRWSEPGGLVIPVFRDPTDAYSYFYNFMTVHAVKPPAPLAAISAGQSDLQPVQIRLSMNAVFPDAAYELRSPRILALGAFDLGFVLVYLLPLAVIALAGGALSREQDSGVLRLIAAQPVSPRTVAAAKFGALAVVLTIAAVASVYLSLALTGALRFGTDIPGLVGLGVMSAAYILFWIALCALVDSFWRGGVQTLAALVLVWATMTVLVPAVGSVLLSALRPAPSRVAYIDESRVLADRFPSSWADEESARRWLATRPDLVPRSSEAAASPDIGRLARDALYRRELAPQRESFDAHGLQLVQGGGMIGLLSPASVFDAALQALADTDMASQLAFTRAADHHAQILRAYFEPLIVANVGRDRPCPTCPARLNFNAYEAVPAFAAEPPIRAQRAPGLFGILYLLALAGVIGGLAVRRLRAWPTWREGERSPAS